jgi:flagellar basal body-associated protein FliL
MKYYNIILITIAIILAYALGLLTSKYLTYSSKGPAQPSSNVTPSGPVLPSIVEVQTIVGATPDGKLGRETQEKWDRYVCDQYGRKDYERAIAKGGD